MPLARTSTCRRTRPRPTCSRRSASSTTTRRSTRCSFQYPPPPQIDFEAALLDARSRQGRRRAAPAQPGPARAVDAGPGAVHAGGDRGAARALRDPGRRPRRVHPRAAAPRSAARSRCCSRRSARPPTRRSPSCTPAFPTGRSTPGGPTIVIAAAGVPGDPAARAPHARARSSWAAACGTRARKLLPDVDERVRSRSRAGSRRASAASGPTTIAMLFRNLVEIAERDAG